MPISDRDALCMQTRRLGLSGRMRRLSFVAGLLQMQMGHRLYNLDVFEHAADSPFGLYGSIPFMLAHKPGLSVGAFW